MNLVHGLNSMRLPNRLNGLEVFGQMPYMQFEHIKDGDVHFFFAGTIEADGKFACAGNMLQQVDDMGTIGPKHVKRGRNITKGINPIG